MIVFGEIWPGLGKLGFGLEIGACLIAAQSNHAESQDFVAEREALIGGQNPSACILSCADSRIVPEFAFDSARGDLFVCRVASNFINPDNLASFEYAMDALKTPLIMVLGHESCCAIKATLSAIVDKATLPGHLPALVAGIGRIG